VTLERDWPVGGQASRSARRPVAAWRASGPAVGSADCCRGRGGPAGCSITS